ncbi:MAG: hypothetical protein CBHOC_3281 [uncultured Caballeronia sp.]|nr:MAG: hypothetical protein CBHOC_3281 [uncultured Caballeronia sp.]
MDHFYGMAFMELHFLNSRGSLSNVWEWMRQCLVETYLKAIDLVALQPVDVIV